MRFFAAAAAVAGLAPLAAYAAQFNISTTAFPASPNATQLSNVISDNYIGISWELAPFDTLWGTTVKLQPNAMKNYLSNLAVRMSKPLRIRIGGNGMDGSNYDRSLTTLLEHIDPDAYYNDIPVHFGPLFFDILNGMADSVGEMQFSIGIPMRNADFSNALLLAEDAKAKLGSRLDTLLLGNEPDLYASHGERWPYDIDVYMQELTWLVTNLTDLGIAQPRTDDNGGGTRNIMGPATCCGWDLEDVFASDFAQFPFKYYAVQRYPNHNCDGENDRNTNLTYYLTHTYLESYLSWETEIIDQTREPGVEMVLSEFNSVSCGGSNISDTFGMSLWAADVGLKAATMNYTAVYLHTREYGIKYNLFDPPTAETSTEPGWRTGSPYYAALFLSEVTDPQGSVIIDLNLNNSISNTYSTVAGYGVYDNVSEEAKRGKLVFFNYGSESSHKFNVPGGLADAVEYRLLLAPSVVERTNISWAGQTVGENGDLEGEQVSVSLECSNGCVVEVPAPGAALVAFGESKFFTGNSTIAGVGGYLVDSAAVGRGVGATAVVVGLIGAVLVALW
ncbi:hypothetical protein BDQ17DRAFT_369785 [Cyathus striatus]|nr:hypothetical protein BDQ17DRAFT_369785 [Cyathus striatus]